MGVATGCGCKDIDSVIPSDARLHINPLHFLTRSAVCSQRSCLLFF